MGNNIDDFVWVQRDDMWVKKYPTSWKGYKEPYTKGKTTKSKIDILTFNKGGVVYKDKYGKEL
jgi:hypothetical protein